MKKQAIIIGLMVLGLTTTVSAQKADVYNDEMITKSSDEDDDVARKGNNIINLYYGPSLITTVYKNLAESGSEALTLKSTGNFGLVYEHMLNRVVGLGVDIGYSSIKMDYDFQDYNENTGSEQTYHANWKFTTLRVQVRANFHFVHTKHFDMYGLVSMGYRSSSFTFTTNDPYFAGKTTWGGFIPFGFKPGIGLRYMITKHIGLNGEIAIGTPVICGGLSLAF